MLPSYSRQKFRVQTWGWRQHVTPKCLNPPTRLHSVKNLEYYNLTATMKTSELVYNSQVYIFMPAIGSLIKIETVYYIQHNLTEETNTILQGGIHKFPDCYYFNHIGERT
jgi:hypothetical protein